MPQRSRETRRPLEAITGWGGEKRLTRASALRALGPVVYAVRVGPLIKIGHTANLARRFNELHADEVLAFVPGTTSDEQAIHDELTEHAHRGREWYRPTNEVLAVINGMRDRLGLLPVT